MRRKVKGLGRQLSGADDDLNFRIIASPVQPLQHAALDQSGEKVANAFLGSKLACRQDEFMSLLGQEGRHRPREASA